MHGLQAAYVRSAARHRLDLMKTLGARREAALGVIGPGGIAAVDAADAAACIGETTTSSRHGSGTHNGIAGGEPKL